MSGRDGSSAAAEPRLRLIRPAQPAPHVTLDDDQARVAAHTSGPLLVLAGPGTGKTTTIVELVARRVESGSLDVSDVLMLTFSRRAAEELRTRVAQRLNRTVREPVARTVHSYAFGLLRRDAARRGEPSPRLLSAPEQDVLVRELLLGDAADPVAAGWPKELWPALATRGFAGEVRDLLSRATERGLEPAALARLGRQHQRTAWVAAARFAEQYQSVTSLMPGQARLDQASLVSQAVRLLESDDRLLAEERQARRLVVVDELQDTDPIQERLVALVAGDGRDLVAVGDPDQSIYGFRGADSGLMARFASDFRTTSGDVAPTAALRTSRRSGQLLLEASRRVASRLGGPVGHRALGTAVTDPGRVGVRVLRSSSAEADQVVAVLRQAHLIDEVPWDQMAVLVRSVQQLGPLRRRLASAGVPTRVRSHEVALLQLPAARALVLLLDCVERLPNLSTHDVEALLEGPLVGADPILVRQLRRTLRRADPARTSGELIVGEVLRLVETQPSPTPRWAAPADTHRDAWVALDRLARLLAAGREVVDDGGDPETVLAAVWSAAGSGRQWQRQALRGGHPVGEGDAHLDAVIALFDAAADFVDRLPGAGLGSFLSSVGDVRLPSQGPGDGDVGARGGAVSLMTAHASKGLEFDVVVVAGVQEGIWPTFRLPGSLLGVDELMHVLAQGSLRPAEQASARLAEERRLFYVAVTRARRALHVTAVQDAIDRPSPFLEELLDGRSDDEAGLVAEPAARDVSLPGLVAELRGILLHDHAPVGGPELPTDPTERREMAARLLARLATAGVPGAHPDDWYGVAELSSTDPVHPADAPVRVSPSQVGSVRRCALRWVLEASGGSSTSMASGTGSLIHEVAHQVASGEITANEMLAEVRRRWSEVSDASGWVDRRAFDKAAAMVARLRAWLTDNPRVLVASEESFDQVVGAARLVGRVDRLERDAEGRLVVVDLKTGATAPTARDVEEDPQLGVYQIAVTAGAFGEQERTGGAELIQLAHGSGAPRVQSQGPVPDGQESWARDVVNKATAAMAGSVFEATAGGHCRVCPVRTSCPVQPEGRGVVT